MYSVRTLTELNHLYMQINLSPLASIRFSYDVPVGNFVNGEITITLCLFW